MTSGVNLSSSGPFADVGEAGSVALRASFLVAFVVFGFVANCVLVATIAQSHRLKRTALNLLVLSVAGANLLDCVVVAPLALGDALTAGWRYGATGCRAGAAALQVTDAAVSLGLAALAVDRLLAVRAGDDPCRRLSPTKALVVVGYVWLHAVAVSLPLAVGAVAVGDFPARHMCAVAPGGPVVYVAVVAVVTYLLPAVLVIASLAYLLRVALRAPAARAKHPRPPALHPSSSSSSPDCQQLSAELSGAKYVAVLVAWWAVLVAPHVAMTTAEQYRNRRWAGGAVFAFASPLALSATWLRLGHPLALPLVTFCWRKQLWRRLRRRCVPWRKRNLINDDATPPARHTDVGWHDAAANGGVPVLFATDDGLHLQQRAGGRAPPGGAAPPSSTPAVYAHVEPSEPAAVTSSKCDVYSSQFLQVTSDTDGARSDYDSDGGDVTEVLAISGPDAATHDDALDDDDAARGVASPRRRGVHGADRASPCCKEDRTSNDSGRGSADDSTLRNPDTALPTGGATVRVDEEAASPSVASSSSSSSHKKKRKRKRREAEAEAAARDACLEPVQKRPPPRLDPINAKLETRTFVTNQVWLPAPLDRPLTAAVGDTDATATGGDTGRAADRRGTSATDGASRQPGQTAVREKDSVAGDEKVESRRRKRKKPP